MPDVIERAATWKCVAALFLDFCTVAFGGGYLIALATGETTAHGFRLHGASTLALWVVVALYFFVGWRYAGGTLWDRIFRIRRPQPDDVGTTPIASDLPGSVRAGVWRRMLALSIDSLIVSVLFQLIVAVLFVATSGRIQMYGDVAYTSCSKLETMPEGLAPPPLAGANFARECNVYFLGAQTARILQVGHATNEGKATEAASQNYMLDRGGHPVDGVSIDWIAMLALIAYLVVMETRTGATLGSRAMGIRVIDAAAPAAPSVPLRKIVLRYLAVLIGLLPTFAGLIIYFGLHGSLDQLDMLFKLSRGDSLWTKVELGAGALQWHPIFGELLDLPDILLGAAPPLFGAGAMVLGGWVIFLMVQIARKRDPLYDRIAGTAVVRG